MSFFKDYLGHNERAKRLDLFEESLNDREAELAKREVEIEELREQLSRSVEQARTHFQNSIEYRRMLQAHQKECRKKDAELDERERELDERLKAITKLAAEKVRAEKEEAEKATARMREQEQRLYKTELGIRDWIKRREAEELAIYDEILNNIERYSRLRARFSRMDGFKFEEYVAEQLEKDGFTSVEVTQKSKDFGADVVAELNGVKYGFQCKYYTKPVGIGAVQQICAAADFYKFHVAVVVTNTTFSAAAKALADVSHVVLWDCNKIEEWESRV